MKSVILAVTLLALSGCQFANLKEEKTLVLKPGDKVVQAKATSTCKDYFFFYRCRLNVDVQPIN